MRAGLAVAAMALVLPLSAQDEMARFGTTVIIPDGLRGQIYFLKRKVTELPDFRKLKPVGSIYTTSLNVPPQVFDHGFPGVTDRFEWFAIDYTGRFWIQYPGIYRFLLLSDDGAKLWIDGRLVTDNDGIHPPQESYGDTSLDTGLHRIEVAYFQGPRFNLALVLKVATPGGRWRVFHIDEFRPPPGTEIPADAPPASSRKRQRQ